MFSPLILEKNIAQSANFYHKILPENFHNNNYIREPRQDMTDDTKQIPCLDEK